MKVLLKSILLLSMTMPIIAFRANAVQSISGYKALDSTRLNTRAFPIANCASTTKVAFSAKGSDHVSAGGNTLLGYATTYTNIGNGWVNGGSTFIAPCAGTYVFTVSFVKDAYYYGGTTDDVYVGIYQNGVYKGVGWAGEGTGNRGTGTYTVVLNLNTNDWVQSFVSSDGGPTRHLSEYNFSGFLIK